MNDHRGYLSFSVTGKKHIGLFSAFDIKNLTRPPGLIIIQIQYYIIYNIKKKTIYKIQ